MMKRTANRREPRRSPRKPKATTEEVLGPAAHVTEVPPKWQPYHDTLVDLRAHFLEQKGHLKQDANEQNTGIQREQADVATNTFNRDWALGTLSADQDALYEIEDALGRIRDGSYGICEVTGKPIPPERLRAIPWTRFSIEGEREMEARGELDRLKPKLGALETVPREHPPESYGKDE